MSSTRLFLLTPAANPFLSKCMTMLLFQKKLDACQGNSSACLASTHKWHISHRTESCISFASTLCSGAGLSGPSAVRVGCCVVVLLGPVAASGFVGPEAAAGPRRTTTHQPTRIGRCDAMGPGRCLLRKKAPEAKLANGQSDQHMCLLIHISLLLASPAG